MVQWTAVMEGEMVKARLLASGAMLMVLAGVMVVAPRRAASHAAMAQQNAGNEPVPNYHNEAPASPLPPTLSPSLFDDVIVKNAYMIAARVKRVLYQEPCYCHCDRSLGHTSLLDCFVNVHASQCNICIGEALYSYEQSKKGKTPAQIREGIKKGEWQSVDLEKYKRPLPAR